MLAISGSHPRGLRWADVVYEEISSPVRYLALFQSDEADDVGPITGTRPADGMITGVLHAVVGYDGGTPGFISILDHQHVRDMGAGVRPSLYHDGPGGIMTSTARFLGRTGRPAPELFPFRGEGLLAADKLAPSRTWRPALAEIRLPGKAVMRWRYDSAARLWRCVAGGPAVSVANLVIQRVAYKQVYLSHRTGITVPSARVFGAGPAMVLSSTVRTSATGPGGLAVHASWAKPGTRSLTIFSAAGSAPVAFAPGRTWVVLAPPNSRVATRRAPA